jgi:hypothetical protein
LLAQLPQDRPTQAVNVGVTTPYILKGKMAIASFKPGVNSAVSIPQCQFPAIILLSAKLLVSYIAGTIL